MIPQYRVLLLFVQVTPLVLEPAIFDWRDPWIFLTLSWPALLFSPNLELYHLLSAAASILGYDLEQAFAVESATARKNRIFDIMSTTSHMKVWWYYVGFGKGLDPLSHWCGSDSEPCLAWSSDEMWYATPSFHHEMSNKTGKCRLCGFEEISEKVPIKSMPCRCLSLTSLDIARNCLVHLSYFR